ncbi:MAG TPA: UDP-N-acetylmuramoyl-L-alanine--D-glutamate ligase [Candidatus Bipolaricaulota bacterium]|nr:UDP-N-acetylmuramoyl-L-alanine--D-glutamate ligase [Candidatus Bipolaricaulota bacterium]
MEFPNFKGKKVTVMGLGLLGRGLLDTKFFVKHGAIVTVTDLKTEEELASSLKELAGLPIKYTLGKHVDEDFTSADLILRNADVPANSPFLKVAIDAGVEIEMDESLFAKYCPCPIIGITGTRGKTTTATLIAEILKLTGKKVFLAGNIMGKATLPLIDEATEDDLVVLELSSWQLQGFGADKISPQIAMVTNIYPDHLNRYANMAEYIEDKKNIYKYQRQTDCLILNAKNEETKKMADETQAQIIWFDDESVRPDWDLKLLGVHNKENVGAALKVAEIFELDIKKVREVCENFKGVENRLEKIAKIDGVTFVNDTTSTTPVAGQAALKAYQDFPIILIAGGADKKLDLSDLAKDIAENVKACFLLEGTATAELKKQIEAFGGDDVAGIYDNMDKAVADAFESSEVGDVILLSPSLASFGLFKNEFDRGDKFRQAVNKLKSLEAGRGEQQIETQFGEVSPKLEDAEEKNLDQIR